MKFSELSPGVHFRIVPDDGKRYIKIGLPLNNGPTWNAKNESGFYNFHETQQVEILNNFKRSCSTE